MNKIHGSDSELSNMSFHSE